MEIERALTVPRLESFRDAQRYVARWWKYRSRTHELFSTHNRLVEWSYENPGQWRVQTILPEDNPASVRPTAAEAREALAEELAMGFGSDKRLDPMESFSEI